ncbi:protein kinase domain-containing protein [Mucisphaera sp.]|uniref:protein kinase domain-containing protein n=1 Tax=Mucisphaera sp. TaxID=2913024 RepID=UPI003D12C0B0
MNTISGQGFRYEAGDRPLEGHTVRRAAGRGGFGEVYFAVTDSGREVALKSIQGFEDVELRGISQCMNLKSPHLVTIFDVRRNEKGEPFVIMEYVAGPSLRRLIDESDGGLGPQKTAYFLREIGKGLSYLHDCGVVHRDLKPGNIFYDEGYVKIGDYGLAKAMAASPQQSQTVTVGTVHYMAPEIGAGRYDRGIDIYAMGVLVYEMLTGRVPFGGASPAEVLMKHLSVPVDVSALPAPFDRVVAKAMAKDPAERYATIGEMVEDVYGSSAIRESLSTYGAEDLTVYARRAAAKMSVGVKEVAKAEIDRDLPDSANPDTWQVAKGSGAGRDERVSAGGSVSVGLGTGLPVMEGDAGNDPLGGGQRVILSLLTVLLLAGGASILMGRDVHQPMLFYGVMAVALGQLFGLWRARAWLGDRVASEPFLERLGYASIAGAISGAWLFLVILLSSSPVRDDLMAVWFGTLGALVVMGSYGAGSVVRARRLSLMRAVFAGLAAMVVVLFVAGGEMALLSAATAAAVALAFRVSVPFDPAASRLAFPWTAAERAMYEERSRVGSRPVVAAEAKAARDEQKGGEAMASVASRAGVFGETESAGRAGAARGVERESGVVSLSPRSRLLALLFVACPMLLVPICGLHRFYVGKWGTGIVWLLTGGLFGIGQLIDGLFIVAGYMEDAKDRRIVYWWQTAGYPAVAGVYERATTDSARVIRQGGSYAGAVLAGLVALVGFVLLLAAGGLAGAQALGAPYAVSAFLPDIDMDGVAAEIFGSVNWQRNMMRAFAPLALSLAVAGGVMLMLSRRGGGVASMVRAVGGVLVLILGGAVGAGVFGDASELQAMWYAASEQVAQGRVGEAVVGVLNAAKIDVLLLVQGLLLVGVLLVAWPTRREVR